MPNVEKQSKSVIPPLFESPDRLGKRGEKAGRGQIPVIVDVTPHREGWNCWHTPTNPRNSSNSRKYYFSLVCPRCDSYNRTNEIILKEEKIPKRGGTQSMADEQNPILDEKRRNTIHG